MNAIELLKQDHETVRGLFEQLRATKKDEIEQIRQAAELASPELRRLDGQSVLTLDLPPEGVALIELAA